MRNILLTYLLIFLTSPIQAQYSFEESDSNFRLSGKTPGFNYIQKNKTYFQPDSVSKEKIWIIKSALQDQGKIWTSPLRINKKDLLFWVPVITATALSIKYDEKIYSDIKDYQSKHKWISDVSPHITYGGDNHFVLYSCGVFYLSGMIFKDNKAKKTSLMALQAVAHAGLVVEIGKMLTCRQRPSVDDGKDYWNWFPASLKKSKGELQSNYDAFPSGHTIAAWSLATVIARQYKNIKIVPPIAYTYATCVGLSRITEDTHWLSDVILGASLGYSIGKFMVKTRKDTRWTLLPISWNKNVMLTSVYRF